MKTIHIHQMSTHSHSANLTSAKVYQGYSKVIRFVVALLALFCFNIGNVWGTDTQVGQFASDDVVTSTTYTSYSDDNWTLSKGGGGTNKSCGYNNTAGNKTTIGNAYGTSANTSHYGYTIVGITKISNANKMTFTYTGGNTYSNGILYLGYSTDGSSWDAVSLKSGSGLTGQGGAVGTANTTYTFEFSSTIASAYYAIIVSKNTTSSDGQFRFDHVTATFYYAAPSSYTVTVASNNDSYGTVSASSVASVAPNTSISASSNVLTVGSTTVTATAHAQDADYNYAFSSWSGIPAGGKVTADVTVIANFTRTARTFTNYRTECDDSAPSITTDPTSLSDMGYRYGSSPTAKSFSMSGENLTSGTLTVTAPTNYEVCKTSGGTYASSITFTGVSGTLSATTVYVRLKSGKSVGDYNDEKVSISGCGLAAAVKVNCSGTVYYEDIYKTGLHTSTYSTYASGESKTGTYTVPSLADVSKSVECEGLHYHFVGWVTDTYKASPEGHIIEATGSKTADNTTYWAVWVQEAGAINYTKVTSTSAVVDGVYVIINNGKYLPNATTATDKPPVSGDTYAVTLSADGSTISSAVSNGMKWYFTMGEGKATIMNAASDGSYLYETNNTNGIRVNATSDTWTVEENSTGFALKGTNNNRYCAIYNNQDWRSYTSMDHDNYEDDGIVYLYKETIEYEDPVTECPELTCGTPTTPTSTPSTYSATLGWKEASPGTKERYEYIAWPKGTDEPTSGYSTSETTSGSVSGLLSNTEYRWKVRKVCTGTDGESGWLKSSFTTTEATVTFVVPEGVSAVSSQSTTSAMPSAGVPSSESKCWAFLGWTTAAYSDYSGGSAPAKLFPNGTYAHLTSTDGTTLYAVYGETEYELIYEAEELVANDNYVLTFEDNSDKIWALSNEDYSTYDAAITEVTSKAREDAYGYYLYNIGANNVWKFTGTSSSGQLYNATADKYLNLSSTTAKILNTTNNLTFTPDGEGYWNINSTNYLIPNPSTSYTVVASIDDDYSALIYHETNALYTTSPDWTEYTVAWKVQGEAYTTGSPSESGTACSGIATMPTAPSAISCADVFMGWSDKELFGTGNGKPKPLFKDVNNVPTIDEDKTFHAVFATAVGTAIAAVEDNSFTSKDENGGYGNSTFSFKSTGKYLQKQSIWNSTNMTNVKVRIRVYHYSNNTADVLRVSLINSSGTEVVGADLNTTRFGTNMNTVGGYSDYVELTPTTAVTGYKVSLKTLNSYGVGINKIEREVVPGSYKDYITACTNEFTTAGNWSTAENWSLGAVPTIHQPAIIKKAAVVDITTAKARSVVIDQNSNTGKLTIQANKALEVAGTITRTTDGSNSLATRPEDLILESSSAGNATLIFDNSNSDQATVYMYSKGWTTGTQNSGTWNWQFVGVPVTDATRLNDYYDGYMYEWDNGWVDKTDFDATLTPFTAYSVTYPTTSDKLHTYEIDGTLVATGNKSIDIPKNTSVMAVANSWTAPIDIASITFTNTSPKNIFLYNTGYNYEDKAGTEGTRFAPGKYICVPKNSASIVGEPFIASMQGFLVKNKLNTDGTINIDYNTVVRPSTSRDIVAGELHAPARNKKEEEVAPVVMKIFVIGSEYDDRVILLEREDFSRGFDDGWDGEKFQVNAVKTAPRLFAINETGGKEEISAVPEMEGTVIGFRPGTDANYKITFDYEGEKTLYLLDTKTGFSTLICKTCEYEFSSNGENEDARFIIAKSPATATGVDNSAAGSANVYKMVLDDHIYIIRNGKMYDVTGILCK